MGNAACIERETLINEAKSINNNNEGDLFGANTIHYEKENKNNVTLK